MGKKTARIDLSSGYVKDSGADLANGHSILV
jgi:hypothetical protein